MKSFVIAVFILFISCSKNNSSAELKTKVVGIQPYRGISKTQVDTIAKVIESFYHIKTTILTEKELPKSAFINIKSPRYRADSIIRFQNRDFPKEVDFVLGLTNKDVSITKHMADGTIKKPTWRYNDFGEMGLAYCPGESAIVSTFRLRNNNRSLESERFKKVVIHEFGHNLGLPHCLNKNCVMTSAAEKIATIDNEQLQLCDDCKNKLE